MKSNPELYSWTTLEISNHATFMDWHGPDTDKVGENAFTFSRLIQTENIKTEAARRKTAKAIVATKFGTLHLVAGKGVMDADGSKTSA
jgi:hypothetical protein